MNYKSDYGTYKLSSFAAVSTTTVSEIVNSFNKTYCPSDPFNFSKAPDLLQTFIPLILLTYFILLNVLKESRLILWVLAYYK